MVSCPFVVRIKIQSLQRYRYCTNLMFSFIKKALYQSLEECYYYHVFIYYSPSISASPSSGTLIEASLAWISAIALLYSSLSFVIGSLFE